MGKVEKRINEIKDNIENNFIDWMQLKVLEVKIINKKYLIDLIDNEGYKYFINYNVIYNSRKRNLKLNKFFRNNIYTRCNIINYLFLNNIKFSLISLNLTNAIEKLVWNCPTHGNFSTSWNEVKNNSGCPVCGKIKSANSRRNNIEYVKSRFEENDLVLTTDIYITNELPLQFVCNKHKNKGVQYISFGNLITGGGCKYCSKERFSESQTKTHEQFIREVVDIHKDKYKVIGKYTGSKDYIKVYCNNCKEPFSIRSDHLLNGHGCNNCNKSLGENETERILLKYNSNFIKQYKFDDCRGIKRKLPFDFAVFNNDNSLKCLIEYQGIQHYKPVKIFGGNKQFEKQLHYDKIKIDYCKNNNIKLIIIPYWEFRNIHEILTDNYIVRKEVIDNG